MKNALTYAILTILFIAAQSCRQKTEGGSCCKTDATGETAPAAISDKSVFLLDTQWETYRESTVNLTDFNGQVIIGAMIFTHCPSACPRIVADMKMIESALSAEELTRVRFLLISMDPDRDTPERMRQFAADHRLNESWVMMRSDKTATMEIAQVLGVRIKPLDDGGFDHSNIIHILNREGEIAYQQQGLNIDPEASLKQIRQLLQQ